VTDIIDKLRGGDRRSIGRSEEVVADVLAEPAHFARLVAAMLDSDPVVRMRSADAVEKATRERPSWLVPYKRLILDRAAAIDQQEIRWHVAQMLPRLDLTEDDLCLAQTILEGYLTDRSRIVQVEAMQALAALAEPMPSVRGRVATLIEARVRGGSSAVRSRGRKLLARLREHPEANA
jgi:hypothetical protein